jgi:SAM-dependent methyltransferase
MDVLKTQAGYHRRAKFYRVEYNEIRDIPFFLSLIKEDVSNVLEVPCGAGRLSVELARKAKHLTAIDIEPLMLASLIEFIEAEGLSHKVTVALGDMTNLELNQTFDLIIVPSEALQLLPQDQGELAVKCLSKHLSDGGALVLDVATFRDDQAGQPDYFDPKSIGIEWHEQWRRNLPDHGELIRSVRVQKDSEKHRFEFLYELYESGAEPVSFSEEMTLYTYGIRWFVEKVPPLIDSISIHAGHDGCGDIATASRNVVIFRKADSTYLL